MSPTRKLKLQAAGSIGVGIIIVAVAIHLGNIEGTSWRSLGLSAIGGGVAGNGIIVLIFANRKARP